MIELLDRDDELNDELELLLLLDDDDELLELDDDDELSLLLETLLPDDTDGLDGLLRLLDDDDRLELDELEKLEGKSMMPKNGIPACGSGRGVARFHSRIMST